MSLLSFRKDRLDTLQGGKYAPSQATVTAYRAGAVVNGGQSATSILVRRAHRFPTTGGVKLCVMRYTGGEWAMVAGSLRTVSSSDDTHVVVSVLLDVLDNDYLVNLGNDGGSGGTPAFDASPVSIYQDPEGKTVAYAASSVTPNTKGDFWYFTREDRLWEVVRDGTSPLALILDTVLTEDRPAAIRWAHKFATSGSGTSTDPWVTSGSNPVQAALDDLPSTGGVVMKVAGCFYLGNAAAAVTIPILSSSTDTRGYAFIGAGRDLTFEFYDGTGSAYRYIGDTFQSNQLEFRGFAVQYTGVTPRLAGTYGFFMTYVSESMFRDLVVGCSRMNRSSGEPDNGFAIGINLATVGGGNVVDFNRIDNCYFMGNGTGVYVANQGDNTVISRCSFEPRQDSSNSQDGMEIHNSYGVTVTGCHFNFFGKGAGVSSFGALQISGNVNGCVISGNYFEGNEASHIYIVNDGTQEQKGVSITGNSFSFTGATSSVGIRAGVDGATWAIVGLNVSGNGFFNCTATNIGIRYADSCRAFVEGGSGFDDQGGDLHLFQTGCSGIVLGGFTDDTVRPILYLIDRTSNSGRAYLANTSASAGPSPRVQFKPGGSSILDGSLYVDQFGALSWLDNAGTLQWSVSQTGDITPVGSIRRSVAAAVTASTTQTQAGGTALTKDVNNVSTVANYLDTVTLPTAVAGMRVTVLNNGANTLQIFPFLADNLGAGVNTATTIPPGTNITFNAYDSTNWEIVGPTYSTEGRVEELVTIAAAATTDTTIDLPANSIILAVTARVTVVIPTATSFSIGDPTVATRFATGVAVAANTTVTGLTHVDLTGTSGPRQTAAAKVRLTMAGGTPAANTGRVKVVIHYQTFTPPTA